MLSKRIERMSFLLPVFFLLVCILLTAAIHSNLTCHDVARRFFQIVIIVAGMMILRVVLWYALGALLLLIGAASIFVIAFGTRRH